MGNNYPDTGNELITPKWGVKTITPKWGVKIITLIRERNNYPNKGMMTYEIRFKLFYST